MNRAEGHQLLLDVRANHDRLRGCARHDFLIEPGKPGAPESLFGRRFRCTVCGGTVDASAHHWYQQGRAHGGE